MATIYPILDEKQLQSMPSQAEAKLYRALRDSLPNDFLILFHVQWILRREDEQAKDGETDFLISHPNWGYICVEVKGGGIALESSTGEWSSIDRHGIRFAIRNPISQALHAKYSIRSKLYEHPRWKMLGLGRVLSGHAVFFPDVGDPHTLEKADLPAPLIGTYRSLKNIVQWVNGVFDFWVNESIDFTPLGKKGTGLIKDVFLPSIHAAPLIASKLADMEIRRITLTRDQIRILDLLQARRRVAVSGGAGTGKTLLALEKAKRLASEGFKTLLTCYNRQLADHLSILCNDMPNITVQSFHQYCTQQAEKAFKISGRDLIKEANINFLGADYFDVLLPAALGFSLEVIEERLDAIVCDEGQDLREEYWIPLELSLSDLDRSPFYIFFDDNQNIYQQVSSFPIQDDPFTLTSNCRNTIPIHISAYQHYKGLPIRPPNNDGDEIQFLRGASIEAQASLIHSHISELLSQHGVSPGDISVLIGDSYRKNEFYSALRSKRLPKSVDWEIEHYGSKSHVLVDTIQRFKGLESDIVFLWGFDRVDYDKHQELIYVGKSRAKSVLIIVGNDKTCQKLSSSSEAP